MTGETNENSCLGWVGVPEGDVKSTIPNNYNWKGNEEHKTFSEDVKKNKNPKAIYKKN